MKIRPGDYTALKEAIAKIDRAAIEKHKEAVRASGRYRDFDMRIRWDIFRATGLKIGDGRGVTGDINLHEYLNDNHIDTALKHIMTELGI
jgi:hypothetical protein